MQPVNTTIIKTSSNVKPMIYAYTTPDVVSNKGWIKIGYTERDVDTRIREQTHTARIKAKKEWAYEAVYLDGLREPFTDKDFHKYLRLNGIKHDEGDNNEWFYMTPTEAKRWFDLFRKNRFFMLDVKRDISPYELREEQLDAVNKTVQYSKTHKNGEFLWNAKPRFGKTLCVYDLMMKINAKKILIVTNRPVIANSWYQDYDKFVGRNNGYYFVSNIKDIKSGSNPVLSYEKYLESLGSKEGLIYFVSLQDLKGSKYFGGDYEKLKEIREISWDILVIDEAHEGVDTFKTDTAFGHIKREFTLHLSGTPFKALASNKFSDDAIFNWTYADEQNKRAAWDSDEDNPYENLPKLNLFTYQMSEIFQKEKSFGQFDFDLNEFFSVKDGKFVHDLAIDKFLDALTTNKKFPFSTPELRNELKHTFWLLNRVEAANLLKEKLEKHKVFENYKIVLAAGNGKLNDNNNATKNSYNKVRKAINENDKTITLSVGQLTTGITIPEWTGVLILSNVQSASLYMQAAFRAQNSCLFQEGEKFLRKENAYVFDFDPARSLVIYEKFANDLSSFGGNSESSIGEILNFFPVIGEDDNGEMIALDPAKVLSIPRKIKSHEIVLSGFTSDYLFSNVFNIFQASDSVIKIIYKLASQKSLSDIKELQKFSDEAVMLVNKNVRDCLRNISRTIPAFLMAYGNDKLTLENFDKIIPEAIFLEVTGITLGEFCSLRDNGKVFASVEFNNAVKEFMKLRKELADYFDEDSTEDIFNYIPSPKTNQIFTPKPMVRKMLDILEEENPGCFDDPNKTFIDPYMKSGLYIAEIVKRLYSSQKLKKLFPKRIERLKHIFEKQVFGLAPTEIIYKITKNFLLDFDKNSEIPKNNLRQFDALQYEKDRNLEQKLDELFGE
ncbi:MAG: DEAD/DEAH box helicase family protein [Synergistaceae bacterium]|nr:DEAD/DEAH box helicase family protein [Synergistaceae bacterium]